MRTRKPLRFAAFGSLLRDARIARKITQAQLARRLKVGQQAVSNWERGTSRPETEALLDRLAQIFPEHDRVAWLQLIGSSDKPTAREIQKPQPVQPLLETLPLDRLSFQQFQTFSALLLELLYSNATVNAFGLEGDTQDGIDIEVRFSDGRYETFQCKRQKTFGPEKVRRAMRKHRVKCNRAVILLSRNATAAARKAVPKSGRWDLWDTEDIARKIRTLPLAKQRRIVDTYFRAYRKAFLGLDDESAFESPEEHFGPLLHRDQVFSHAWTLAGRDRELERLIAMTDRERRQVTLLIGSGGIGKSRLIRAISESYRANRADHAVFILSVGRAPSAADFDALNDQPSLVIIEDAHEQPDIGALLARLARASLPIRLLITTRPYAAQLIRSEARHNGLHADENGSVILQPLTVDQAESVAREILHDRKGPVGLARQIAWLTRGSPLALVVGSYLVATARIHPAALNNSQEFRDELFGRFRDALTGHIGHQPEHEIIRNTLDLIALLQPIDPESTSMASVAQQVLHFSMDRVKRAIQLLHDAGVLVRRGRMFRIVPDLFAEYVLEDASVLKATGRSSGYVERIVPACDEGQLANMLLNISKLDWRLTEADESQSQLADAVWLHIETAYDSSPAARDTVVEAVAGAAYYQPRRALKFYDRLSERGHWHRELPILLKHVALNVEYIEQAASRLWELGQNRSTTEASRHPHQILAELAAIEPNRSVEYCERIVRFAMHLVDTGRADTNAENAFRILRAALATEGHTTETRGHSLVFSGFGVNPQAVATLRLFIIDFLLRGLGDANIHVAIECATALEDALRYPHGLVGRVVSDDERGSWSAEFVGTLRRIRSVIEAGDIDPFVIVRLQHAISWHAHFAEAPTADEARAALNAIPQTLGYRLSAALADGWGHLRERSGDTPDKAIALWNQEQKQIAEDIVSAFPSPTGVLNFVRERLGVLNSLRGTNSNSDIFIGVLLEIYPELAASICEYVIANPQDPFRAVFGRALHQFAINSPDRALVTARAALDLDDVPITRSVSAAYGAWLHSNAAGREQRALIEQMTQSDDDFTVTAIVRGIAAQAGIDRSWTVATLLSAPVDRSAKIADDVCCIVATSPELPFESLGEPTVLAFFDKLLGCPSIQGHWIEEFLARASRTVPASVVQFLIKRIERAVVQASDFQPMPYLGNGSRLKFRETGDVAVHLRTVREWLSMAPKNEFTIFWGPQLYRWVAAFYDDVVVADLGTWTKSNDAEKLEVVARILSAAPQGFVFHQRAFVVEALERAAAVGQRSVDRLQSSLWASAISGTRQGAPGEPFPEDLQRRDSSMQALERISRGSPAWSFFNSLKLDAERDIRRSRHEDAELFTE